MFNAWGTWSMLVSPSHPGQVVDYFDCLLTLIPHACSRPSLRARKRQLGGFGSCMPYASLGIHLLRGRGSGFGVFISACSEITHPVLESPAQADPAADELVRPGVRGSVLNFARRCHSHPLKRWLWGAVPCSQADRQRGPRRPQSGSQGLLAFPCSICTKFAETCHGPDVHTLSSQRPVKYQSQNSRPHQRLRRRRRRALSL